MSLLSGRSKRQLAIPAWLCLGLVAAASAVTNRTCKHILGDAGWPSQAQWQALNATVGGRLIATIPQASVCHLQPYADYDESLCADLQTTWGEAQTFELKPAEMMNPYYQNRSCDPFTNSSTPCELGNYASYSINVTGASDIQAGLSFARSNNIRLAIKNTGHDYTGKSTGKAALSLWTHNLKSVELQANYTSHAYSGPAIKLGAGLVVGEAYEAAAAAGYRVVGGECGSVGISGGYSQGGGHSILNSAYGMGSDQVLEWELVTAQGEHLVATPAQNPDLYWALSGGGGGTYGVVLSMTSRLHADGPFTGGSLAFTLDGAANNKTTFWHAVSLWFQRLPQLTEEGRTLQFVMTSDAFEAIAVNMPDVSSAAAVQTLLAPYTAQLDSLGIPYTLTGTTYSSFVDYFNATYGPLPYGPEPPDTILTSRIIPRTVVHSDASVGPLLRAINATVEDGTYLVGCSAMTLPNTSHPANAVLPAWRDAIAICNVNAYWDYTAPLTANLAVKDKLVQTYQPMLEAATPGSGVYLNEIDPLYTGDWKLAMYGENYERLLGIKHAHDPDYLLYGHFAVGGDEFAIDSSGRLCPAAQ